MDALWYVFGAGGRRNYEDTIYLKHTLPEFLSWLQSLAINTEDNSLSSILRKHI